MLVLLWAVGVGVLSPVLLPAVPAQAEALVASEPGVRQELDRAPGWVTLAFGADVDPSMAKVLVTDADGDNITTGSLIVEGTNVTTQLRDELEPGTYTVRYRVNRPDGEPEGGAYQFAFGDGAFREPSDRAWTGRAQEPEAMNDPDPNAVSARPAPTSTIAVPDVEVERQDSAPPTSTMQPTSGVPSARPSGEPTLNGPTAVTSPTGEPSSTPSASPEATDRALDLPPWPVWLGVGAFGVFLIIAAVAFLRSRR